MQSGFFIAVFSRMTSSSSSSSSSSPQVCFLVLVVLVVLVVGCVGCIGSVGWLVGRENNLHLSSFVRIHQCESGMSLGCHIGWRMLLTSHRSGLRRLQINRLMVMLFCR